MTVMEIVNCAGETKEDSGECARTRLAKNDNNQPTIDHFRCGVRSKGGDVMQKGGSGKIGGYTKIGGKNISKQQRSRTLAHWCAESVQQRPSAEQPEGGPPVTRVTTESLRSTSRVGSTC